VDLDFVVNTARTGKAAGATRFGSRVRIGADATSRILYNRVKGEMPTAIAQLGYESVVIAQPDRCCWATAVPWGNGA
jgi:hypothetical protein